MKMKNVWRHSRAVSMGIAVALGVSAFAVSGFAEDMNLSGKIIDMSKSGDINYTIYSGYSNFYRYDHDSNDVTKIIGGNITIGSAEQHNRYNTNYPATIHLVTDSSGIDLGNNAVVDKVLNNLANKLTYNGYANGERNLDGTVQISSGLTASSVTYSSSQADQIATIHFNDAGRGYANPTAPIVMQENSSNVVIDEFTEHSQTYSFSHDASDPTKIYGGNIIVKKVAPYTSDGIGNYGSAYQNSGTRTIWLVTDSSGIDIDDPTQVTAVLNALGEKITYEGYTDTTSSTRYSLYAYAKIAEGLTSSDWMHAYGNVTFDNATGVGGVKNIYRYNHIYKDMITTDGALTQGPNGVYYNGVKLAPEVTDNSKDAILAAIRPVVSDEVMNISFTGNGSTPTVIDVSGLNAPNGKVYGIYNGAGRTLKTNSYLGVIDLIGSNLNYKAGIYAEGAPNGNNSTISFTDTTVKFTAEQDGVNAIEAGKGGDITLVKSSGTLSINANGHKINGVVADDGGSVEIGGTVNIDTNGGKALYAKDGGTIIFGSGSNYLVNINGDIVTEGTGKIDGTLLFRNGTWNGNLDADADVTLTGAVWNGDNLSSKSKVSLGSESTWNGQIVNGNNLSIALSNWNDTATGDTVIGTLDAALMKGLRGVITKQSGNLTINDLDGQVIIGYTHDVNDPTKVSGPDVNIKKAEENSTIALRTDSDGIDLTNTSQVQKVFNSLADKLTYEAYKDGERNLEGSVEISEGLTAGAQAIKVGNLAFNESTGKATALSGVYTTYTAPITGDLAKDTVYAAVATANGDTTTYNFTEDTYINNTIDINGATEEPTNMKYGVTVYPDAKKTVVINMNNNNLYIENNIGQGSMAQSTTAIIYPLNTASSIIINDPGKIDLSTFSAGYYAGAIAAGGRYAKTDDVNLVQINNKAGWDNVVKARGVMGMGGTSSSSIFNVNWTTSKVFNHGHVDIKGWVDYYAYGAWNLSAIGDDGWISIGGGKLISENYTSLDAYNLGTLWVNAKGNQDTVEALADDNIVQIGGNMKASGQWVGSGSGGFINVGFTNSDSWFDGVANASGGSINLIFKNGAQWTNRDGGFKYGADASWDSTLASTVDYFYGAKDAAHTGYIYQAQDGDLEFQHYNGYTTVYYKHDTDDVTKFNAGYTVIDSAAEGSGISIRTDNDGIDTKNETQVTNVLNGLAAKLIYNGYTEGEDNLTGYAEIAEGMTSSSIIKQQQIRFDKNSGSGRVTENPLGQTSTLFINALTGEKDKDISYKRAGTIVDGKYVFTDATVIKPKSDIKYGAINIRTAANLTNPLYKSVDIVAQNGVTLDLNGDESSSSFNPYKYGVYAGNGSTLNYKGNLSVRSSVPVRSGSMYGRVYGIYQQGETYNDSKDANITIDGNVTIKVAPEESEEAVTARQENARGEQVVGILNTENGSSSITVNGMVDIDVTGSGVVANSYKSADGSINIKGGSIIAEKVATTDGSLLNNHTLAAYAGTINMGMEKQADGTYKAGSTRVEMEGNILTLKDASTSAANRNLLDGTINLALTTPNSYWKGVADNGNASSTDAGAKTDTLGTFNLYLQNGALWTNEVQGSTYKNASSYYGTVGEWDGISHVTNFVGGSEEGKRGIVSQLAGVPIEIDNYSGNTVFVYGHNSEDPTSIIGGDVTIHTADEGSVVKMLTDRDGIDLDDNKQMNDVLASLAQKLTYTDATNGVTNLEAHAVIGEGLTSPWAEYQIGDIQFSETDGKGSLVPDSVKQNTGNNNPIYYGQYETLIMSGAKSAMASAALMWRNGLSDLDKRMGDLRLAGEDNGVWVNVYGGNSKYNSQNTQYSTKYKAYQLGYDFNLGNGWKAGAAVSYTDGDGHYVLGGKGDLKNTSVSLYGTWLGDKGHYTDIVVKGGQVENDYKVYNEMGHKVEGDYKTKGYSVSAEYGRKIAAGNGWYVTPQAQLTYGRLTSESYTAGSDMKNADGSQRMMDVSQDAFNSFVGRLGVGVGHGNADSNIYFKASLSHEFSGDFSSGFTAEEAKSTQVDFGGTWATLAVGGSKKLSGNSYFYGNIEKSFGGDTVNDWRADLGLRWSF